MSIRVLRSVDVPATTRPEVWLDDAHGLRTVLQEGVGVIADDGPDTYNRAARFATNAGKLRGKTVAWIGGGLGVGPALFDQFECIQTIFEIEPSLAEFMPTTSTFVPGDWHVTLNGQFDVIVWDLDDNPPRRELTRFLNRNGIILPIEVPLSASSATIDTPTK